MSTVAACTGPVVRTVHYDGPLDLLLHLVQRDGIDVRNLPLVHITREYLAILEDMDVVDLDLAGEFLAMAALLCELKSRELVPGAAASTSEAEEEDPRAALVRRILEYRRFCEAAEDLERRIRLGRDVFARIPERAPAGQRAVDPGVDALGLLELWQGVRRRKARPEPVHDVEREPVNWLACVKGVLEAVADGAPHTLDELLARTPSRPVRIVTFLAVLELCRLRAVDVSQREHLAPILLHARLRPEEVDLSSMAEAM